jgi:hypothetical protein
MNTTAPKPYTPRILGLILGFLLLLILGISVQAAPKADSGAAPHRLRRQGGTALPVGSPGRLLACRRMAPAGSGRQDPGRHQTPGPGTHEIPAGTGQGACSGRDSGLEHCHNPGGVRAPAPDPGNAGHGFLAQGPGPGRGPHPSNAPKGRRTYSVVGLDAAGTRQKPS